MSLHEEIKRLANESPAVFIGESTISQLCLRTLEPTLANSTGKVIGTSLTPFGVKVISAAPVSGSSGSVKGTLVNGPDGLKLSVLGGVKVVVDLGVFSDFGDPNGPTLVDAFSQITLLVDDISFEIDVDQGTVSCNPDEARFRPSISRVDDDTFNEILTRHGLERDEVSRAEGLIGYSSLQTLIAKTIDQRRTIDLRTVFPGVRLEGSLRAEITGATEFSNQSLCIVPGGGISRTPGSICECATDDDSMGGNVPGSVDRTNGRIRIGGPRGQTQPDIGRLGKRVGDLGFFVPNGLANEISSAGFPAIRKDIRDNGFIGYKAAIIVDFSRVGFEFDIRFGRPAIVVTFEYRVEVYGRIRVDLGKLGKPTVGKFEARQSSPGANRMTVAIVPVLSGGAISLKPILEDLDLGDWDVDVRFFAVLGSPFGTKAALVGFVLDEILADVAEKEMPRELRKAIRKFIAKTSWKIIDVDEWLDVSRIESRTRAPVTLAGATLDALNTSMLITATHEPD